MRHGVLRVLRAFVVNRRRTVPPTEPPRDARVTTVQIDRPERTRTSPTGRHAGELRVSFGAGGAV